MESAELDEYLDMALNLSDQCMSLKGAENANRNLVDLIPIPKVNPTFPGEMSTPRKEIIELAIKPIQDAFAKLDEYEGMIPTVSTMPEVNMVLKVIGDINMRSLIWSDPTEILVDPRYRAMNPAYHLVTLNCPDTLLSPDLPGPLANLRVPAWLWTVTSWSGRQEMNWRRGMNSKWSFRWNFRTRRFKCTASKVTC